MGKLGSIKFYDYFYAFLCWSGEKCVSLDFVARKNFYSCESSWD